MEGESAESDIVKAYYVFDAQKKQERREQTT